MNFALPEQSLVRLAAQINLNGTFSHTVRGPWGSHQVMFSLKVERGERNTNCTVEMGGERHSISVANANASRHIELADFIDAIANGRIDSAEPAPGRVTRQPLLIEDSELLTTDQQGRIKYMARHGGFVALELGLPEPINVAVHRTHPGPGITAIVSIGNRRPRTSLFTTRGTEADCVKRLMAAIEHTHIIATPRNAAAA